MSVWGAGGTALVLPGTPASFSLELHPHRLMDGISKGAEGISNGAEGILNGDEGMLNGAEGISNGTEGILNGDEGMEGSFMENHEEEPSLSGGGGSPPLDVPRWASSSADTGVWSEASRENQKHRASVRQGPSMLPTVEQVGAGGSGHMMSSPSPGLTCLAGG